MLHMTGGERVLFCAVPRASDAADYCRSTACQAMCARKLTPAALLAIILPQSWRNAAHSETANGNVTAHTHLSLPTVALQHRPLPADLA